MAFNINAFRNSFKREPQRPNMFKCLLIPPISLLPVFALTNLTTFEFRCMGAQLPGRSTDTFDWKNGGYGPVIKIANGSTYHSCSLEIIMTQTTFERILFASWLDYIQPLSQYNTDVKYYDNYTGTLIVNCYNSEGNINHILTLFNAFPIDMGGIELHWDANNRYVTFRVAMAYERYQSISPSDLPGGFATEIPLPEISLGSFLQDNPSTAPLGNVISSL